MRASRGCRQPQPIAQMAMSLRAPGQLVPSGLSSASILAWPRGCPSGPTLFRIRLSCVFLGFSWFPPCALWLCLLARPLLPTFTLADAWTESRGTQFRVGLQKGPAVPAKAPLGSVLNGLRIRSACGPSQWPPSGTPAGCPYVLARA